MDLRKTLYESIVLSGGTTMFTGFGERLLYEVRRIAPPDTKIRISAPQVSLLRFFRGLYFFQERIYSTWIGGSILASLDTFRNMWVSKREYEEEGKRVIHRKFF